MIGITSIGAYLPKYRISERMINEAWGRPGGRRERTVGYFDEDSLTMGISATDACLDDQELAKIDGLCFSSTTSPYKEKLASTTMAMILNLPPETRTLDLGNSLRSGTSAAIAASDSIRSGSLKRVLVAASECGRLEMPGGMNEGLWGDGACALALGEEGVLLNILGTLSYSDELTHYWRRSCDEYVQSEDIRFPQVMGYARIMEAALGSVLKKFGVQARDFAKVVIDAPDARSHQGLMKRFGFDPKTQVQDSMHSSIGSIGAAHPFLMLASVLDGVRPGDRILWGSYGDGSDFLILQTTEEVLSYQKRGNLQINAWKKGDDFHLYKIPEFQESPRRQKTKTTILRSRD